MVRIAVVGASGRLGRRVVALASSRGCEVVCAQTRAGSSSLGLDAGTLAGLEPLGVPLVEVGQGDWRGAQAVIDVSLPEGTAAVVPRLQGLPFVTGVTGLGPDVAGALDRAAREGPVVVASNFSRGVAVLTDLVTRAARALPDADLEIVEVHHRHKVDAPSGTARRLGEALAQARGVQLDDVVRHGRHGATGPRSAHTIGMHALRGGDVVGEHTVWLATEGERLMLGHVASTRDTFALGALQAARWASTAPAGRWGMPDVLGLTPTDPVDGGPTAMD